MVTTYALCFLAAMGLAYAAYPRTHAPKEQAQTQEQASSDSPGKLDPGFHFKDSKEKRDEYNNNKRESFMEQYKEFKEKDITVIVEGDNETTVDHDNETNTTTVRVEPKKRD